MNKGLIRVLMIEDNLGDARLINEMLKEVGQGWIKLEHSVKLSSGIERLQNEAIDIVLLDLGLPDSRGINTLIDLRKIETRVPIVVLTGLEDDELGLEAVKIGAQDYLSKMQVDGNLLYRTIQYAIERKKIEEKLRESEERFRSTFDKAAIGIAHISQGAHWLTVNKKFCDIVGFGEEEILSQSLDAISFLKNNDYDENFLIKLWNHEIPEVKFEKTYKRNDNSIVWIRVTLSFVEASYDEIPYIIAIVEDITEKKNAEEQIKNYVAELQKNKDEIERKSLELQKLTEDLKELNASKDKFFSILAHDLRSPFSALLGISDFLNQHIDELDHDEIKDFSNHLNRSLNGVFRLVENLLQWSRVQSGRIEYEPVQFNLNSLIDEIVELYKPGLTSKQIKLIKKIGKCIDVYADKNMIDTVLRNLISNAVKFTHQKGKIEILVEEQNEIASISIIDNGMGISEEDQKKLFKIDETISTEGTDKEKGTGLGLVLCKEFIEKNSGKIWVGSKIGYGSKFTFTLPAIIKDKIEIDDCRK